MCVACEQDWYELLCCTLECRDVLDKCDVTTPSGKKATVEVMNVAVWRWHERVWNVTTNDEDKVSALLNFGTRRKMQDAAPNFGYTNVETATNAVSYCWGYCCAGDKCTG